MSEQAHDPNLTALEASLAALTPQASQLNRDQLLFRAGQASVQRRPWTLPLAGFALLAQTAALAVVLLTRPTVETVERIVYQLPPKETETDPSPTPVKSEQYAAASDYFKLREHVLAKGIEGLPKLEYSPAVSQPMSMDELLDLPPGTAKQLNLRPF